MASSVFIALPAFGQVMTTHTTYSLMELAKRLIAAGWDYYFSSYTFPDIGDSRNLMTTAWFDTTDAEWMLQVDADMGFPSQLVLDGLAFGKPVMGCTYPKKTYPIQYVGAWGNSSKAVIENGFMRVDGVGFGVTLIHRSAIQGMLDSGQAKSHVSTADVGGRQLSEFGIKRVIRAFDRIRLESGDDLSEDFSFCLRHRNSGGEVWANINHRVTHVGQHGYSGRYADSIEAHPVQQLPPVQFHRNGKARDGGLLPARAV